MAAEKAGKPRFGAKSEFVRSLDRSLSAADVVALAEKKGMRLSPAFVYNIRSAEGRAQQARGAHANGHSNGHGNGARRRGKNVAAVGTPEAQLRAAIAQIGLVRAREILEEVEETFTGA